MKKIYLLSSLLLSLPFIAGCSNNSNEDTKVKEKITDTSKVEETTTKSDTSKAMNGSPMDLDKISDYNYEDLEGDWYQVAKAKNGDMEDNWTSDNLNDTLQVKGNTITVELHDTDTATSIKLDKNLLSFDGESIDVSIPDKEEGEPGVQTQSNNNGNAYIGFYPTDTVLRNGGYGLTPSSVDPLKEKIFVYFSHYGKDESDETYSYTAIFQRDNLSKDSKAHEEKLRNIIDTEDDKKYVEAYKEFSLKGNPMPPEQRGSAPLTGEFLEEVGLPAEKYTEILWGVYDYYGDSFKQGIINEDLNVSTRFEAHRKLQQGYYGSNSKRIEQSVTKSNVVDYVKEYVKNNEKWDLEYPEIKVVDSQYFQVFFFSKDPNQKNVQGYFKVTPEGMVSRYSNSDSRLSIPEQVVIK